MPFGQGITPDPDCILALAHIRLCKRRTMSTKGTALGVREPYNRCAGSGAGVTFGIRIHPAGLREQGCWAWGGVRGRREACAEVKVKRQS